MKPMSYSLRYAILFVFVALLLCMPSVANAGSAYGGPGLVETTLSTPARRLMPAQ